MDYIVDVMRDFRILALRSERSSLEKLRMNNKGELFVLNYLFFRNQPALPSEMSAAMGSSTARISAILKVLEERGEIGREVNKDNRTNVLVSITDAGRLRAGNVAKVLDQVLSGVFADMGEQDAREFIRIYNRFLDCIDRYPIPETMIREHKKRIEPVDTAEHE